MIVAVSLTCVSGAFFGQKRHRIRQKAYGRYSGGITLPLDKAMRMNEDRKASRWLSRRGDLKQELKSEGPVLIIDLIGIFRGELPDGGY
jgi:hypothetical protein